jgi:hypothetical protein
MTPGDIRVEIVGERSAWVREMLTGLLRALPLGSYDEFASDLPASDKRPIYFR